MKSKFKKIAVFIIFYLKYNFSQSHMCFCLFPIDSSCVPYFLNVWHVKAEADYFTGEKTPAVFLNALVFVRFGHLSHWTPAC